MTDLSILLVVALASLVVVGYLANMLAFIPADRFPPLRFVDHGPPPRTV